MCGGLSASAKPPKPMFYQGENQLPLPCTFPRRLATVSPAHTRLKKVPVDITVFVDSRLLSMMHHSWKIVKLQTQSNRDLFTRGTSAYLWI